MAAQHRFTISLAVAAFLALAPQGASSAEDAAKAAAAAKPAPAASGKTATGRVVLAEVTPPWRLERYKSSFTRIQKYILRARCAHIGCPGVHTLGVAY
jgi:hypothetical protein